MTVQSTLLLLIHTGQKFGSGQPCPTALLMTSLDVHDRSALPLGLDERVTTWTLAGATGMSQLRAGLQVYHPPPREFPCKQPRPALRACRRLLFWAPSYERAAGMAGPARGPTKGRLQGCGQGFHPPGPLRPARDSEESQHARAEWPPRGE